MKSFSLKTVLFIVLMVVFSLFIFIDGVSGRAIISKDTVQEYLKECTLLDPVQYDNMTVIPIQGNTGYFGEILTLDEALAEESIEITEVSQSGSVNRLSIKSTSKKPVFIMAGEILKGSKQDRVLKNAVLVSGDGKPIQVDAYCIEQGRWSYQTDKFYSDKQAANISVRQKAREQKSQSEVWQGVASTNERFSAAPSGSLTESFSSEKALQEQEKYFKHFEEIPKKFPKANGAAIIINGRVLAVDLFADRSLFGRLWGKLCKSYVLEAISQKGVEPKSGFSSVKDFLKTAGEAKMVYTKSVGLGRNVELESEKITGSGLTHTIESHQGAAAMRKTESRPVHLEIFPRYKETKVNEIQEIRRDYRQNIDPQVQQQIQD